MTYSKRIIEGKQNLGASTNIKQKARELRKRMTQPETILWSCLRKRQINGFYFRRQHPYFIYILDFYCFEADLAIEVDGGIHLSKKEYDSERTRFLNSSGITVIRFSNTEVESHLETVIDIISNHLLKSLTKR